MNDTLYVSFEYFLKKLNGISSKTLVNLLFNAKSDRMNFIDPF